MTDNAKRNSNIELLRIVLILMVILLHFNNSEMGGAFNYVQNNKISYFFLNFLESFCICAVNCFMVISGYFLTENKKIKTGKILDLLLIVIFYQLLDLFARKIFMNTTLSISSFVASLLPFNYFAILYLVIYIFSPFINNMINKLNKKEFNIFMFLLVIFFILFPTIFDIGDNIYGKNIFNGLSTISTGGNGAGYTIINFFVCYCLGVYLKKNTINIKKDICI